METIEYPSTIGRFSPMPLGHQSESSYTTDNFIIPSHPLSGPINEMLSAPDDIDWVSDVSC
jgi:hypothetical protein